MGYDAVNSLHCAGANTQAATVSPATLLDEVWAELQTARQKFPGFNSPHEGYAVLLEEVDELWEEVRKKRTPEQVERMRKECVQIAAMALRFVGDLCNRP